MLSGCTLLTDIKLPNTLTKISVCAFLNCTALENIVLPERLNTIEGNAFYSCTSLKAVKLPQSVKTLGGYAFYGCSSLADLIIEDYSIKTIEADTFKDCPSLKAVVLPKGLKTVGNEAFMNDTALTEVTIPDSVTSISSSAFSYPAKTTVYGSAGSYAEEFATDGGFTFNNNKVEGDGFALADGAEYIEMEYGDTYRAVFEFFPENATDTVVLTASNNNVSINGMDIYAAYTGDTVITAATSSGLTYEFTVHIRKPSKITVKQLPDKTRYKLGENFDKAGMLIEVTYNDGYTKETTDYTVTGFNSDSEGECTVTVKWGSVSGSTYSTTLTVEIYDPAPKLTEITVARLPYKLIYAKRTTLETAGLVIKGIYDDGSEKEITDYTCSKINVLKLGEQVITVTYGDFTTSFNVTVTETGYLEGDVNQDGVVDIRDLVRLKKRLLNPCNPVSDSDPADIDRNKLLNALDIASLRKILLGIA